MSAVIKTCLVFLIYSGLLLQTYASVSGEDDVDKESLYSQSFSESSRSSGKKSIASQAFSERSKISQAETFSDHDFTVDDDESIHSASTARDTRIEKRGQKLNQIYTLKNYFKKGFLEITPESYKGIVEHTLLYTTAFESYDRGIALKGWKENDDLLGMLKLVYYFLNLKSVKWFENKLPSKTTVDILSDIIQHYEEFETLDVADTALSYDEIKELLIVLPNPSSLKTLNIQASMLSSQTQSEIKKKYPNISEFIVGIETPIPLPKPEPKREESAATPQPKEPAVKPEPKVVKETPVTTAEITIEKVDEPKTASLKPLPPSTPRSQAPIVTSGTSNALEIKEEDKLTALARTQPTRKLTQDDIKEALKKVKAETLSWTDFAAFISSDPTLTTLDLSDNKIGNKDATALAPSLKGMTALTTLNLYKNLIGDAGATALAPSLKGMTALITLDLHYNWIGDSGATALAPSLQGMMALTTLDLSFNQIWDGGISALAPILKGMTALTTLNFNSNRIGDAGATALAPSLKGMTALTTLDLSSNKIGDKGATALAPFLEGMTALTTLYLDCNQIGDKGATALAPFLEGMTALTTLYLNCNQIGDKGKKALKEVKRSRPSLVIRY